MSAVFSVVLFEKLQDFESIRSICRICMLLFNYDFCFYFFFSILICVDTLML
jgi:hypothetical protein